MDQLITWISKSCVGKDGQTFHISVGQSCTLVRWVQLSLKDAFSRLYRKQKGVHQSMSSTSPKVSGFVF
jgi:hypothetical protein